MLEGLDDDEVDGNELSKGQDEETHVHKRQLDVVKGSEDDLPRDRLGIRWLTGSDESTGNDEQSQRQ